MSCSLKGYNPVVFPIDKSFEKLTKKEAEIFFQWFINIVDERADYLRNRVARDLEMDVRCLDFSLESLVSIWEWFINVAEITYTPKSVLKDLERQLKANMEAPEFVQCVLNWRKKGLSVLSRLVLQDIGMYVGKTMINNFSGLRWDYHTDLHRDSFANIPQVFGFVNTNYSPPFPMRFDPIHYAEMQASKILENTENKSDLYNICLRWTQWATRRTGDGLREP